MCLIPTMMLAGALGGSAYCLLNSHPAFPDLPPDKWTGDPKWTFVNLLSWLWKLMIAVVLGNAAAFTVPVLLHVMSSDLIREIVDLSSPTAPVRATADAASPVAGAPVKDPSAWYLFFGFCVVAAYAAPRFLQAVVGQVLKQLGDRVTKIEEKARSQASRVSQVEEAARFAQQSAEEVADDISEPEASVEVQEMAGPLPALTDEESRTLTAFQEGRRKNQWLRRSLEGLVTETNLTEEQVIQALRRLVAAGLVQSRQGRGRPVWLLTATGIHWRPPETV